MDVLVGRKYKHFKGHIYEVLAIAKDSENLSLKVWVRPIDEFISKVDKNKYPEVNQENRFELIND